MPIIRPFGVTVKLPDLDQLFCYETVKLVNVLDWIPGTVYYCGVIFTILYCFGFALVVNQQYLDHTQAFGSVLITATGDAWSSPFVSNANFNDGGRRLLAQATPPPTKAPTAPAPGEAENVAKRYWDVHDATNSGSEAGGIVLATRVVSTKRQTMQPCPNKESSCPAECTTNLPIYPGICYPKTEYCMEYNWCPLMGQGGAFSTDELIEGIEDFELTFTTTMNFDRMNPLQSTAVKETKMKVSELLNETSSGFSAIQSTGVVIWVRLQWGTATAPCTKDGDCEPQINAVVLEEKTPGYSYRKSNYYRGNGTMPKEYRDVSQVYGIRVLASSTGYATGFSIVNTMLQVACAFAMAALAYVIADLFVVWLNFRRSDYIKYKIEETPDLNELKRKAEEDAVDAQVNKKGGSRPRKNKARQPPPPEIDSDDE